MNVGNRFEGLRFFDKLLQEGHTQKEAKNIFFSVPYHERIRREAELIREEGNLEVARLLCYMADRMEETRLS